MEGIAQGTEVGWSSSADEVFVEPWSGVAGRDTLDLEFAAVAAEKLGIVEGTPLSYHTRLGSLTYGYVPHEGPDGEVDPQRSELHVMANSIVVVREGAEYLTRPTQSYDPLVWMPMDAFLELLRTKDPEIINHFFPSHGFIELCPRGMCVSTSGRLGERRVEALVPREDLPWALQISGAQLREDSGIGVGRWILEGGKVLAMRVSRATLEQLSAFAEGLTQSAALCRPDRSERDNLETLIQRFTRLLLDGDFIWDNPTGLVPILPVLRARYEAVVKSTPPSGAIAPEEIARHLGADGAFTVRGIGDEALADAGRALADCLRMKAVVKSIHLDVRDWRAVDQLALGMLDRLSEITADADNRGRLRTSLTDTLGTLGSLNRDGQLTFADLPPPTGYHHCELWNRFVSVLTPLATDVARR